MSNIELHEPTAYFDLGEHTLTFHLLHGRGQHSGAAVAEPYAHVCRWRDGRLVFFQGYSRQNEALDALGVTRDSVEPIAP